MSPVRICSSTIRIVVALAFLLSPAWAQGPPTWQSQIDDLRALLAQTRAELQRSQNEILDLRQQVLELKSQGTPVQNPGPSSADQTLYPTATSLADRNSAGANAPTDESQDQQSLLAAQVAEQSQSKVESASKYNVRLSGMVLMNTFTNRGGVDIQDLPMLALPARPGDARGSVGATFRQTWLGLDLAGPELAGAQTGAELQMDFFGGFPDTKYGVTAGLVRLRTARVTLDWPHLSILAGQDAPFVSPRSPTSYATLGEPAFAWSGNLWVWTPQVRVERSWDVSENSSLTISGGILDPLTEAIPDDQFQRAAGPGESSRQPALAARIGWKGTVSDHEFGIGVGTYYARQRYSFARDVDSWATTADWLVPLGSRLEFSGEMFRGRALGGLGGGIWNSVLFNGNPSLAATQVIGMNTLGGWSQLKLLATPKLEFNLAAGTDNPFAEDLQRFPDPSTLEFPPLARNQSWFINGIYHPRSNLLLALEYRKLRTYLLRGSRRTAHHVNLEIGVSF
jgi:hypothetical protein